MSGTIPTALLSSHLVGVRPQVEDTVPVLREGWMPIVPFMVQIIESAASVSAHRSRHNRLPSSLAIPVMWQTLRNPEPLNDIEVDETIKVGISKDPKQTLAHAIDGVEYTLGLPCSNLEYVGIALAKVREYKHTLAVADTKQANLKYPAATKAHPKPRHFRPPRRDRPHGCAQYTDLALPGARDAPA